MAEPLTDSPPLRIGRDGRTASANTLGEIRDNMASIAVELATLLAKRFTLTQDAAFFKANPNEVAAPEQQARNLKDFIAIAQEIVPEDPAFHRYAENVGKVIITEAIKEQLLIFEDTVPAC